MRFGNRRGVAFALVLVAAGLAGTSRADLFHDIPREVDAVDVNQGGPYYAPPIPYGCYAKEHFARTHAALGLVHGLCGKAKSCLHCGGRGCRLCGDPCDSCGGNGCDACGHRGFLHRGGGDPCALCGGSGCGFCRGLNLFGGRGHCLGGNCDSTPRPSPRGLLAGLCVGEGGDCGLGQGADCGLGQGGPGGGIGHASTVEASGQGVVIPSSQSLCGSPGCTIAAKHHHRGTGLGLGSLGGDPCASCHGRGCGLCGGQGFMHGGGDPCASCHGRGCGLCGGQGFMHGGGDPCASCHGRGCGLCGGRGFLGGLGCRACGGRGCGLCAKGHSLLGLPMGLVNKALHRGEIKYFVGPGGPVPITPGYVPYVVTMRSPRDYFAFPPFVDTVP